MARTIDYVPIVGQYRAKCERIKDPADVAKVLQLVDDRRLLFPDELELTNADAARLLGVELVEAWETDWQNTVVNVGKNHMLDNDLQTSVAIVGPYMGLISSTSYSAIAAADTMASHSGWLEAGNANAPTYSGNRKTCAWSAASAGSKSLSAGLAFSITGTGTVKGAFVVYGTNAVNTLDSTAGTLFSAGLFGTGDRAVLSGDTITVSYTVSL